MPRSLIANATRSSASMYAAMRLWTLCFSRVGHHVVEAVDHDLFQPLVHHVFIPEEPLAILHPFKIRNSHAAGVRQDVRNDEDFLFCQNRIGNGCRRSVRAFAKNASRGLDAHCAK